MPPKRTRQEAGRGESGQEKILIIPYPKKPDMCVVSIGKVSIILPVQICNELPEECILNIEKGCFHEENSILSLVGTTIKSNRDESVVSCGGIISSIPFSSLIGEQFSLHLMPKRDVKSRK